MRKASFLFTMAVVLLLPQSSFGWNDTGHMVIGRIAYERLNETAKARMDRYASLIRFRDRNYDAVTLACWMDDFRSDPRNEPYAVWHYINIPIFVRPFYKETGPARYNVLERIKWCSERLKSGRGPELDRARFVGYLEHLVGDLHQPLHCATRYSAEQPDGDAGGNGFKIVTDLEWLNNLHRYWDSAGGLFGYERIERPLTAENRQLIERYAREVAAAYPARRNGVWRRMNPEGWVAESHQLARRNAYSLGSNRPDAAYKSMAQRVARERIALAGYRLAALLNNLIGSE